AFGAGVVGGDHLDGASEDGRGGGASGVVHVPGGRAEQDRVLQGAENIPGDGVEGFTGDDEGAAAGGGGDVGEPAQQAADGLSAPDCPAPDVDARCRVGDGALLEFTQPRCHGELEGRPAR